MTDIVSPLPGTFYHKPDPNSAPFKSAGDTVAVGDTIGLIEVMKTFIEVKAEAEGTFADYVAPDASPVSAGDVLAKMG
ncbi:acetyl-CoA carboxylase biotin carboxyl carrier protein subunit [Thioclava marina]|uniref:Biotin carboxyl carrier protein of acetyl-CoA carboxylase n=1 Tax=Thioclava marina TaxID=1915077 RepID=A0ABX3MHZ4_9RHOB|nr:acetyl-CoA carboxylase [Thioclava marina]MBD3738955.1 biotin carboxyl carrier domain-containing protein [Stutzerimonas balearica]OOY11158.1 acetyl-CoA carboxylase biotin carboxyl carrier protein subunit [Thioclava marina]